VGTELAPMVKHFTKEDMVEAEDIAALFGRSYETIHNDEEIAKRERPREIIGSGTT
jgi:hypothetical protein